MTFPTFGGRDNPPGNILGERSRDHGPGIHEAVQGAGGQAGDRRATAQPHGAGAGDAAQHLDGAVEEGRWRKPEHEGAGISEDPAVLKAQVRELQRRLKRAEMEKDILKKATAYFASQSTSVSSSSSSDEE